MPARIIHTEFCPCPSEPFPAFDSLHGGPSRGLHSDQRLVHRDQTPEPKAVQAGVRSQTPGPLTAMSGEEFDSFRTYCGKAEHGAYAVHRARRKGKSVEYCIASPGPGTYDPKTSLSTTGTYFITNFRNAKTHSFSKAAKRDFLRERTETPGPGAYAYSSDFGPCEKESGLSKKGRVRKRLNRTLA